MATQKLLKFIHIAKNAGMSIEAIGKEHGLMWGGRDPEYKEAGSSRLGPHLVPRLLSPDYLAKHDFFIVVRNPYKRVLSQILFTNRVFTANHLNDCVKMIEHRIRSYGGVHTEQYKYAVPGVHILHFENLETEFNALMAQYGLPARLTKHINKSRNASNLTVNDFDANSIQLIQRLYKKDFETFGYSLDVPQN